LHRGFPWRARLRPGRIRQMQPCLWRAGSALMAWVPGEGVTGLRCLWADADCRVYPSRLLGGEAKLVLHGGGNTSVKTVMKDLLDEEVEVLCVKGSGWDMAAIEPAGLPPLRSP